MVSTHRPGVTGNPHEKKFISCLGGRNADCPRQFGENNLSPESSSQGGRAAGRREGCYIVPRRCFSAIHLVELPPSERSRIRLAVRLRKRMGCVAYSRENRHEPRQASGARAATRALSEQVATDESSPRRNENSTHHTGPGRSVHASGHLGQLPAASGSPKPGGSAAKYVGPGLGLSTSARSGRWGGDRGRSHWSPADRGRPGRGNRPRSDPLAGSCPHELGRKRTEPSGEWDGADCPHS